MLVFGKPWYCKCFTLTTGFPWSRSQPLLFRTCIFYHSCVFRNLLIVDCWPPHRQAFHLLPWQLLFWVNPFKGGFTLQLRILELSNLMAITVISIYGPFSFFVNLCTGPLIFASCHTRLLLIACCCTKLLFFFANCCTKQFFCNYHTISFFQCVIVVPSSEKVK